MRRLAALVPNVPGVAPGQRTRIEFWAPRLVEHGWTVDLHPFEDARLHDFLYQPGRFASKAARMTYLYGRQLRRVMDLGGYDAVLVYREAALLGPAVLERLAVRHGLPMVYDLDDPTFLSYRSPTSGWMSVLKIPGKTGSLCRMADHVTTINGLIGEFASRHNPSVTVVPMFLDVDHFHPRPRAPGGSPRIVWMGSHTTMVNLGTILPALTRLQADRQVLLRTVGAGEVDLPGLQVETRQWSEATEVADLQDCDIGIVPLTDLAWNRWKFFFKTIQYMAVGLPVVARRLGSNVEIIEDGVNGFLAESQEQWYERLRTLVDDPDLRRRMGEAARATVVERYSADLHIPRVAAVLDSVVEGR